LERSGFNGASRDHPDLGNYEQLDYIHRGQSQHSHSPDTERRPENSHTKGKAGRERGWWRTGKDKLASYGLDTEVWISQNSTISDSSIIDLEAFLQTKSEKDLPDMRSEGTESIYWAGTESGLMDIHNFPGVIYATDSSKGST